MVRFFRCIVGLLLIAILVSCNFSSLKDFEQGQNFVDSSSGVVLIDTMKIVASTVRFDSIVSSKLNRLLVGGYSNIYTGTVTCSPFFELNSGSSSTTATDLVYDSLVIKMNYDGYYIGDTTKLLSFKVKRVSKVLKLNTDGYLYNNSSFLTYDANLAEKSFYPTPKTKGPIYFHLSDVFGKELFNKILNKNDTLTNSTYFKDYFRGMALVCTENQNQAALGFLHDSISCRVYYHQLLNVSDSKIKTYFSFPISSEDVWYNKITSNVSGSLIQSIGLQKTQLSSALTSNLTMVQGGSGIYTKIKIPGVDYVKGFGKNVAFIAATLQMTPLKESYSDNNPLPDSLSVYIVDHKNMITSQYSNTQGNIYATKVVPSNVDQLPYYMIDVTQFFDTEIADGTVSDHALLIGTVATSSGKKINPFAFIGTDTKKDNVKLNVYCYIDKSN